MGFILALASAVFCAMWIILAKVIGSRKGNFWVNSAAYQLVGAVIAFFFIFLSPQKITLTWEALVPVVLAWVFTMVSSSVGILTNRYLEVSINTILMQFSLVGIFIGSVIFFHEEITPLRLIGAGLVFLATVVVFARKSSMKDISLKGVQFRFLASACFVVAMFCDKHNSANYSTEIYTMFAYLMPGLGAAITSRVKPGEFVKQVKSNLTVLLGMGISSFATYYLMLQSFKYIDTSLSLTITSLNSVLVVIFGIVVFKERQQLARKIIALIIVIAAGVILNFA
jgi:drug/metabolite transporter (DMT)-like permease